MNVNVLKELLLLNKSGVYALFNHADKRVLVGYSMNMGEALMRILKKIQNNTHRSSQLIQDKNKLEFQVLEPGFTQINLKLITKRWCKQLVTDGYALYLDYSHPKLKIEFQVIPEHSQEYKVRVVLVTSRYNKIVVGEFSSMPEARKWVTVQYGLFSDVDRVVKKGRSKKDIQNAREIADED